MSATGDVQCQKRSISRVVAEPHNNGCQQHVIRRYGHGEELSHKCESVCTHLAQIAVKLCLTCFLFHFSILVMKGTSTYKKGVTRLDLTTQTVKTLHCSGVPNESA